MVVVELLKVGGGSDLKFLTISEPITVQMLYRLHWEKHCLEKRWVKKEILQQVSGELFCDDENLVYLMANPVLCNNLEEKPIFNFQKEHGNVLKADFLG